MRLLGWSSGEGYMLPSPLDKGARVQSLVREVDPACHSVAMKISCAPKTWHSQINTFFF